MRGLGGFPALFCFGGGVLKIDKNSKGFNRCIHSLYDIREAKN